MDGERASSVWPGPSAAFGYFKKHLKVQAIIQLNESYSPSITCRNHCPMPYFFSPFPCLSKAHLTRLQEWSIYFRNRSQIKRIQSKDRLFEVLRRKGKVPKEKVDRIYPMTVGIQINTEIYCYRLAISATHSTTANATKSSMVFSNWHELI